MMKKGNILVLLLICIVLALVMYFVEKRQASRSSDLHESINKINWEDYQEGLALAASTNKPVMLYFHAQWCQYCEKMQKTTFVDTNVAMTLHKKFVCIRIDVDENRQLARDWNVRGLPFVWFLSSHGSKIMRIPGFVDSGTFLVTLGKVLNRHAEISSIPEEGGDS